MSGKAQSLASLTPRIAELHEEAAAEIAASKRLHTEARALLHRIHHGLGELHAIESHGHETLRQSRRRRASMKQRD
jgi:hypothetical protein